MDLDDTKVEGAIRERAERTQIAKKRSISFSLTITTINDDAKIPITDECLITPWLSRRTKPPLGDSW
jgi:hypothetical protein